jgi:porphobilinogen synthase
VRETTLSVHDFIFPLFVRPGKNVRNEIVSMPGNYQLSVDRLIDEVGAAVDLGIRAFIFFGIPGSKDAEGSSSWQDDGIVQQALRALRPVFKEALLITDECFCEYTDHGHCGIINDSSHPNLPKGYVLNDPTLDVIARVAVSR